MNKFKIVFKSGTSVVVKSEHLTLKHIDNELTAYHFEGLNEEQEHYPLYIRVDDVAAVFQNTIECGERRTE